MTISYEGFEKVDSRSGVVIQAEFFERAKNPIYKIWVDFSDEIETKKTSAQKFLLNLIILPTICIVISF